MTEGQSVGAAQSAAQAQVNPLTEAKADSLDELMSRDPFGYTKADRSAIVSVLRAQREVWAKAEAASPGGKKVAAPKAKAAKVPPPPVDLGDLGL